VGVAGGWSPRLPVVPGRSAGKCRKAEGGWFDAHDLGAPIDLAVGAFDRIGGVQLGAKRGRKAYECPGIGASLTSGPIRRPNQLQSTSDTAAAFPGCLLQNGRRRHYRAAVLHSECVVSGRWCSLVEDHVYCELAPLERCFLLIARRRRMRPQRPTMTKPLKSQLAAETAMAR
jgi:hypothetical protein